jgi:hypothetical protein
MLRSTVDRSGDWASAGFDPEAESSGEDQKNIFHTNAEAILWSSIRS